MSETEEFRRTLNEGGFLLRMNKPTEALEKLLPLYEIAPANIDVAINLGGAYILLRKWEADFRCALPRPSAPSIAGLFETYRAPNRIQILQIPVYTL